MAVWGCEGGFTAPSLCSFVSPNGETHGEAAEGLCGGREWWLGMVGMLSSCGAVEPQLGSMLSVPDSQDTVGLASNVTGDVPEDRGTSFGAWGVRDLAGGRGASVVSPSPP